MLYVGDSLYAPTSRYSNPNHPALVLFPNEGDLPAWWRSTAKLLDVVRALDGERPGVRVCAGHVSVGEDAQGVLEGVRGFVGRVLRGGGRGGGRRVEEGGEVWGLEGGGVGGGSAGAGC